MDASVTPSATGACCSSARESSSTTKADSESPSDSATSSASVARAARDSQRSRTAPAVRGGVGVQPAVLSTARTSSPERQSAGLAARGPTQARHRLAHLGSVEEPLGAAQDDRHARLGERLLQLGRLGVDAEEHGDVARGDAVSQVLPSTPGDLGGLLDVVVEHLDRGLGTGADAATGAQERWRGRPSRPGR